MVQFHLQYVYEFLYSFFISSWSDLFNILIQGYSIYVFIEQ